MKVEFFIAIIISNGLIAQNLVDYSVPEIDWKKWDMLHEENNAKLDFIKSFYFEYPENGSEKTLTPSYAKIVDVDGDTNYDLLYLEQSTFHIYINKSDTLHLIHSANERIAELSRDWPDAPLNFKTANFNCCEGNDWEFNYYHYYIDNNHFSYQIYRTEIIADGTKNLFRNMPPTQIKVGASSANLVFGPGSVEVIKSYQTGRTGYAIASMKGEKGKLWWKVFIKEKDYKLRAGWVERNKLVPVYQSR